MGFKSLGDAGGAGDPGDAGAADHSGLGKSRFLESG